MQIEFEANGMQTMMFDDRKHMEDYITGDNFGSNKITAPYICFGVIFDSYQSGNWQYSIRYNVTGRVSEIYSTIDQRISPIKTTDWSNAMKFVNSGFLTV